MTTKTQRKVTTKDLEHAVVALTHASFTAQALLTEALKVYINDFNGQPLLDALNALQAPMIAMGASVEDLRDGIHAHRAKTQLSLSLMK